MPDGFQEPKFSIQNNVIYLNRPAEPALQVAHRGLMMEARHIADSVKELSRIRQEMEVSIDKMTTVRAELAASSELRELVHERCTAAMECGDLDEMIRTRDAMQHLIFANAPQEQR